MLVRPSPPDKRRAQYRARRRRWRRRRAQGKILIAAEVDEHRFIEALQLSGRLYKLPVDAIPTRAQLAAAAGGVLADFRHEVPCRKNPIRPRQRGGGNCVIIFLIYVVCFRRRLDRPASVGSPMASNTSGSHSSISCTTCP